MSVFVCKRHFWWRQIWRHLHVTMLKCWPKFSNVLIRWNIRIICAKNYETAFKFVKVMCCRRPNTSKFRYTLINTSKLIPTIIITYLVTIRDDLNIWNIDWYIAAVIGPLIARADLSTNQRASFMSALLLVCTLLDSNGGCLLCHFWSLIIP